MSLYRFRYKRDAIRLFSRKEHNLSAVSSSQLVSGKRLEWAIIAFLMLALLSLVVVYLVEPAIYATVLGLERVPTERYPLGTTLFLFGISGFVLIIIGGVRRHWRWLFWLLLVAFGCAILEIPATLLQLAHVLPGSLPVWYGLYRIGIALGETGIAVWMGWVARQTGAWGMGKRLPANPSASPGASREWED